MLPEFRNITAFVEAVSNPAFIIRDDLTVKYGNEAFYAFCHAGRKPEGDNGHIDSYLTLNHSWDDDDIIIQPFKNGKSGEQYNVMVKNAAHNSAIVSLYSVPLINGSDKIEDVLIVIQKLEGSGLQSDQILDLIEQQEEYFKDLAGNNEETALTGNQLKGVFEKQHRQLLEANQTLRKVKEEMNDELEMAKNVQNSLLPSDLPDFTNITISTVYIPAGKVGGDFYDIINTQTQKIAILIFDVSGHGVPAALIGATAKMLFAHYIETLESPSMIFREVNSKICSFLKTEHYLTAFLGILDPIQNTMVYSRAGHVKPIVYSASEKKVSTLDSRGSFIGHSALADFAEYMEDTVTFEPDDKILFYTDGLTEGCNKKNELYGKNRLLTAVKEHGELPLDDLLHEILEDQNQFRQGIELRDDFTMLCIQIGDAEYLLKESGFTKKDAPNILIINKMGEIEKVCSIILRAMDNCGFSDRVIKRTKICIFEMAINALVHGNKNDPEKKVLLLYKVAPNKVAISVVDDGEGYDYNALPNPLDDENLLKDFGRGVFIIKNYMDEVQFNARGNRILVVKYHEGIKK